MGSLKQKSSGQSEKILWRPDENPQKRTSGRALKCAEPIRGWQNGIGRKYWANLEELPAINWKDIKKFEQNSIITKRESYLKKLMFIA